MKPKKIAFFNYLPIEYGGGLAQYYIQISTTLQKNYPDLEISIVTFNKILARFFLFLYSIYFFKKNASLESEKTSTIKKHLGKVKYYKATSIKNLKEILMNHDVIYSKNDLFELLLLKLFIGYKYLSKVIIGFHTPIYYEKTHLFHSKIHNAIYSSFLYKFLIKDVWKYHVINSFDEYILKKLVSKKKVIKVYNPFDDTLISENNLDNLPFKKKGFTSLWIGRLTNEKGIPELINLIQLCNKDIILKNIQWVIVGSGELEYKVMEFKKSVTNIQYLGYIEHKEISRIYRLCDVLVSTSHFETFPYIILEAQRFGIPTIAYNIHGNSELIQTGKNGFLVTSLNEFKVKIKKLIRFPISKHKIIKLLNQKINNNMIYNNIYKLLVLE